MSIIPLQSRMVHGGKSMVHAGSSLACSLTFTVYDGVI